MVSFYITEVFSPSDVFHFVSMQRYTTVCNRREKEKNTKKHLEIQKKKTTNQQQHCSFTDLVRQINIRCLFSLGCSITKQTMKPSIHSHHSLHSNFDKKDLSRKTIDGFREIEYESICVHQANQNQAKPSQASTRRKNGQFRATHEK